MSLAGGLTEVETKAHMEQVQGRVGGDAYKRMSVGPLLRNCGRKRGSGNGLVSVF